MWSELRPQYVKADMHFVQGIDRDPLKLQFLKSIQQIAETCRLADHRRGHRDRRPSWRWCATWASLTGRATSSHAPRRSRRCKRPTRCSRCSGPAARAAPEATGQGSLGGSAEKLLISGRPGEPGYRLLRRFSRASSGSRALHAVPVVEDGKPIGLIERHAFLERFVRPFRKELFGRKPCSQFMDDEPADRGKGHHHPGAVQSPGGRRAAPSDARASS